jgi:hypothetical protein
MSPLIVRNYAIAKAFRRQRHAEALLWEREAEVVATPDDEDARHRVLGTQEEQLVVALHISLETLS